MKKIIPTLMALILAIGIVSACSCIYLPETRDRYDNAQYVFSGKAINIVKMESYPVQQEITFKIEKYWKLNPELIENGNVIIRVHEDDGANCGYTFNENEEYLIYAFFNEETGRLSTSACMGNFLLEEADEEISNLNDIKQPSIPNQEDEEPSDNIFSKFFNWVKNLFS